MNKIILTLLITAVFNVNAAIIDVTNNTIASGDGQCDLVDAIDSANSDTSIDGCTAGSGSDNIRLAGTVNIFTSNNSGANGTNGLPVISSTITFQTIGGLNRRIQRDLGAPSFRLFEISSGGDVQFRDIQIEDGTQTNGACILNNGTLLVRGGGVLSCNGDGIHNNNSLTLNSTVIRNNTGDGINNEQASLTINRSQITLNGGNGIYSFGASSSVRLFQSSSVNNTNYGIRADFGTSVRAYNSTISSNNAGGINITGGFGNVLNLTNSTIAHNTGSEIIMGLGVSGGIAYNATINAQNTLVYDNVGTVCSGNGVSGTINNNLSSATCYGMSTSSGINLTSTLTPSSSSPQYHALSAPSSAINSGDNGVCSSANIGGIDERNANRPEPGGTTCDVGAYELQTPTANPSISLTKSGTFNDLNSNGFADAGETITYSFVATNTGNVILTNVSINDPLVTVAGNIASFAVGATDNSTFSAVYTLTQLDIDTNSVFNEATINATAGATSVSATASTTVSLGAFNAQVTLTKSGVFNDVNSDGFAQVGETITYSFDVLNSGNVTLKDLSIDDPLITVNGFLLTLAPGLNDNSTFTATYTLTATDINNGFVSNLATVNGSDPFDGIVSAQSNAGTPLLINLPSSATIALTKTGVFNDTNNDGFAQSGETITYSFDVQNTGTVDLNTITISDPLGTVNGSLALLAIGTNDNSTFSMVYTLTPADITSGSVSNMATANAFDPGNVGVSAQSNAGTPLLINLPSSATIALTKTGVFNDTNNDGFAQSGETITYSFDVQNTGTVDLNTITISDPLGTVNGSLALLAIGTNDNSTFSMVYTLTPADITNGSVSNLATANAFDPGNVGVSAQSNAGVPLLINLPSSATIALTKTGVFNDTNSDGFAQSGETITYSFDVQNTGTVDLNTITISDPLGTVNGSLALLAIGTNDNSTFSMVYTLTPTDITNGSVSNLATVNAFDPSNAGVSAQSNAGTPLLINLPSSATIALVKTGVFNDTNSDGFAQSGETITYSFDVQNTGTVDLNTITISDPLGTVNGSLALLAIGTNDNSTFSMVYTLTPADITSGSVSNLATVNAFDPGNVGVSAQSNAGVSLDITLTLPPIDNVTIQNIPAINIWGLLTLISLMILMLVMMKSTRLNALSNLTK